MTQRTPEPPQHKAFSLDYVCGSRQGTRNQIGIEQVPVPRPGYGEAVIRVTLTTIGGTDLHILKGEYAVRPGGKERMRRLMELVRYRGLDLAPMLTHTFSLDEIVKAYHFFGERRDGVIKLAIKP